MTNFDYKSFIESIWLERRDIVSDGFDKSLNYIKEIIPELKIHRYKSGTDAWTWIIPKKWSVKKAFIKAGGKVLLDLKDHPFHVMSYSAPISAKITKSELLDHLYYSKDLPGAIPWKFSYYEKKWGFCIEYNKLKDFVFDEYEVCIDSVFEDGELKVAELFIPGATEKEIVIMTHLCHPCMVDDGLSGVAVMVSAVKKFLSSSRNHYSYRFLILPETIGSIAYLSHNEHLLENMKFGVFLDILGSNYQLSLQKSRQGATLIDMAAEIALRENKSKFKIGEFLKVACNDEKILNGPGVNIPAISLCRTEKFGSPGDIPYPEYHSSADTPDIVSVDNLEEAESVLINTLKILDDNYYPKAKFKGPICLSRYGLWAEDWIKDLGFYSKIMELFYCLQDGEKSLIEIAYELNISYKMLKEWLDKFHENNLIAKTTSL